MNRYLLAVGLVIALSSLPVAAGTGMTVDGDCAMARDPARCLAMRQARQACKDKRGNERRRCLQEKIPAPDCGQDKDPSRCEARRQARLACKGKIGKAMHACLRALAPDAAQARQNGR